MQLHEIEKNIVIELLEAYQDLNKTSYPKDAVYKSLVAIGPLVSLVIKERMADGITEPYYKELLADIKAK